MRVSAAVRLTVRAEVVPAGVLFSVIAPHAAETRRKRCDVSTGA